MSAPSNLDSAPASHRQAARGPVRAVALLSGGLDSMLAIRALQLQGVEVDALNFQTLYTCCRDDAARAALELGVRLTVVGQDDEYLELIRKPRYGYGKGANPCVDCRIYMFQRARTFMEDLGAHLVASGEVLGQRPNSQKRRHLAIIAHEAGLDDRLLRPLSARLLPRTAPEREGLIDRERLYRIHGRSRRDLIRLARQFGLASIPQPSTGCSLTEKSFAGRVHDLVQLDPESCRWDFELLNLGRHLRLDERTKVVVGRNEAENHALESMYAAPENRAAALVCPANFTGPIVLVIGPFADEPTLQIAGGVLLRFSKHYDPDDARLEVQVQGSRRVERFRPLPRASELAML